jgi:hypothetical protein
MLIFDTSMSRSVIHWSLLLLLNIHSALFGQEPRQSYLLNPGETYQLEIEIQQNTYSESTNSDEITLYSKSRLEFTIDSVKTPDLIYASVKYVDLSLSMLAPGLNLDVNSNDGSSQLLSSMMDSLERHKFRVITDSRGALLGQEGLGERFQSLWDLPGSDSSEHALILNTLREVYGPDAFSSLYTLFVNIYPVIQPMRNWTNDVTYYFNTKPVQLVNRYQLARTTEDIMIIQGMGMINAQQNFREKTDLGEVESVVTGSQTYDFQMDRKTGWVKRCVSRQRILIETTIVESRYLPPGLKIPSYTETVFEINGSIL